MKKNAKVNERYIKRVGPKGVTVWTWTEQLAERSDCFEVSKKEALHLQDPENNPAPPNIINLQHLDDNLITIMGSLSEEQQRQLMVMVGQVQHGQKPAIETPGTALDMGGPALENDSNVENKEDQLQVDKNKSADDSPPDANPNGKPSASALNKMTKSQLQEHSTKNFPGKPEFDIEDPNNTNDFIREKINEWWDEL